MSEIEWEDPPAGGGTGGQPALWPTRLAPLVDHPKRWAKIRVCDHSPQASQLVFYLRHTAKARPAGEWEFRTDKGTVYARYLGPNEGA